jgi:hypothetical protein
MPTLYYHATGPWPAGHYADPALARAAAANNDFIECTEAGTYAGLNLSAGAATGLTFTKSAGVGTVGWDMLAGTNPAWLLGNGTTVAHDLTIGLDNSHVYGIRANAGVTASFLGKVSFKPLSAGSGDNRALFDLVTGTVNVTGGLDIVADPTNGFVLCYMQGGVFTLTGALDRGTWPWYRIAFLGSGTSTLNLTRVQIPIKGTGSAVNVSAGTATVNATAYYVDKLNCVAVFGGSATMTMKRCGTSAANGSVVRIATAAGTVGGTWQNCYGQLGIYRTAGTCTVTGDHNSYVSTEAGTAGTGDVPVTAIALWGLKPDGEPRLTSPLVERGVEDAVILDARGRMARQGRGPAIGPVQPQYQMRSERLGRNGFNLRQRRAAA